MCAVTAGSVSAFTAPTTTLTPGPHVSIYSRPVLGNTRICAAHSRSVSSEQQTAIIDNHDQLQCAQIDGPRSGTHSATCRGMVCRRSVSATERWEQLVLALDEQRQAGEHATSTVTRVTRGQVVPRTNAPERAPRVRALPARDGFGRFVAFPTTNAPSWFVFCCDNYRIAGEPATPLLSAPSLHEFPRAIARCRRPRLTRAHLENAVAFLLFMITLGWYWWHLPRPHH